MNQMEVSFAGKTVAIFGGPYPARPANTFGVKLAVEIHRPCDVDLPIPDFSVPRTTDLDRALVLTTRALIDGKQVYAGCMAGRGRTGLFMASFCQAFGVSKPVEHVRKVYNPHAVETNEQYKFVMNFAPSWQLRTSVWRLKFKMLTGI